MAASMLGSNGRPVSSGLILSASSGGISRRHNGKLDTNSWSPIKISKAIAMFLKTTRKKTTSLGTWVNNQRAFKKRSKLSPERIDRLEAVGFVWISRKALPK
jgi:hypothetical protein